MSRAAFAWLGGAAMALGAIIAGELAGDPPPPPVAGAAIPAFPGSAAAAAPAAGAEQGWLTAILGRPLFDPSRRPPHGASASEPLFRLSGTVVGPGGRQAIFEPAGGGRAVVVREGQKVGSAVVRSIAPGTVLVVGAGGPRVIQPSYSLAGGGAGTEAPALVPQLGSMAAPLRATK